MPALKKIVLIGGGGHAKVVLDAISEQKTFRVHGIIDNKLKKGSSLCGIRVIGGDEALPGVFKKGVRSAFIAVGSVGNCATRKRIYKNLKRIGFELPVIKHPKAVISKSASLGEGTFVAARVAINPDVKIGTNAIINTTSSIDHDCVIGDYVHVAPGAILSGGVTVGAETHIGSGASIIQSIAIGAHCIVGAGAIVRRDVADDSLEFGGPRRGRIKKSIFIIAEAGVNHNGSLNIAKKMVDKAVDAGADAIKFQAFNAEKIVARTAPKAQYQKIVTDKSETQLEMMKRLELSRESHNGLTRYCKSKKIQFLSSPFDIESVDMLAELGQNIYKIPSGQIVDLPYLRKIGSLKKKVIMSTGMASLDEIKDALNVLTDSGTSRKNITLLHCNTEYPTAYEDANILAMLAMKEMFMVDVGYSDHTPGIEAAIAAAALGATVIEKHFTLDKSMEGPDHKASLEPHELKAMVSAVRNVEKALGSGVKKPSASELKNLLAVRKSIVASRPIKAGEILSEENITTKRPGTGASPMMWDNILGKTAARNFREDELITT